MATGNIKIFISRLNDFEIAQSADEKLMRRKKKKLAKTREAILSPESSSFSVSGAMPGISRYFIYDYYSVLSKPSDSSNPSRPRHSSNTIGKKGTVNYKYMSVHYNNNHIWSTYPEIAGDRTTRININRININLNDYYNPVIDYYNPLLRFEPCLDQLGLLLILCRININQININPNIRSSNRLL